MGGTKVIKISDTVVVKIGATEREAKNQEIARTLVDPRIVYIPEVHRFCRVQECGYLVMEYVHGKCFNEVDHRSAVTRLFSVLDHFSGINGTQAGPLNGGQPSGLLWFECGASRFSNAVDIEDYFNIRLKRRSKRVTSSTHNLVLAHLDIAERNILFLDDGTISILDWDSAGFYPQVLEFCALCLNRNQENDLVSGVLDTMSEDKAVEVRLLVEAWVIGQKGYL